jgi:hypothetical protein
VCADAFETLVFSPRSFWGSLPVVQGQLLASIRYLIELSDQAGF